MLYTYSKLLYFIVLAINKYCHKYLKFKDSILFIILAIIFFVNIYYSLISNQLLRLANAINLKLKTFI